MNALRAGSTFLNLKSTEMHCSEAKRNILIYRKLWVPVYFIFVIHVIELISILYTPTLGVTGNKGIEMENVNKYIFKWSYFLFVSVQMCLKFGVF